MPESLSYLSSDGEEEEDDMDQTDYPCLNHHPRPAAVRLHVYHLVETKSVGKTCYSGSF
jgi:hypothetical protein